MLEYRHPRETREVRKVTALQIVSLVLGCLSIGLGIATMVLNRFRE